MSLTKGQYHLLETLSGSVDSALSKEYARAFGGVAERNTTKLLALFRDQVSLLKTQCSAKRCSIFSLGSGA